MMASRSEAQLYKSIEQNAVECTLPLPRPRSLRNGGGSGVGALRRVGDLESVHARARAAIVADDQLILAGLV